MQSLSVELVKREGTRLKGRQAFNKKQHQRDQPVFVAAATAVAGGGGGAINDRSGVGLLVYLDGFSGLLEPLRCDVVGDAVSENV